MTKYDLDNLLRAETYTANTEIPNVKAGDWVISSGMFGMNPYYAPTNNGFLWKVIEILPRQFKYDYLKAVVECPADKSHSQLKLSMLYVLPYEPDSEFIEAYNKAHETWLNRE